MDFFEDGTKLKIPFEIISPLKKKRLGKMFIYLIWTKMPRNSEAKFGNYSHSSVGLVQKDLCTAHCKVTNFLQKLEFSLALYINFWLVDKSMKLRQPSADDSFIEKA